MLSRSDTELIGKTVEAYGKVVNIDELLTVFEKDISTFCTRKNSDIM
jgi:hypothetical protein